MASYLVDSSVLLDVFTKDPRWSEWSLDQLERAWAEGTVFINPAVYAEISIRFSRIEELEAALTESDLVWSEIPREALFLAGKAFLTYRKRGGQKTSPLPDFFIGAHAAVSDLVLITRDPKRVLRHFPKLRVSSP
ncbi:MAG TPA: type II toxin-antitoxin system VapC family toxin [Spirochaetia bacterium]|nr:type II toxin-antitoxin system VapC family toxin [Spirochaetia bacterium]